MKWLLAFIAVCLVSSTAVVTWALRTQYSDANAVAGVSYAQPSTQATVAASTTPSPTPAPTATPAPLPDQVSLTVPYTMQAPFNVWDALHEDACEEASLIMVKHSIDGTPMGTQEQADKEITDLVHWEEQHGYGKSITLEQLNQIAKDYYGLNNGQVVQTSSIDEVKTELAGGHPVILGMAGKLLPNPYFSNGGPNYHMLVAKGYDSTGIITDEPGTFHGDGFHYDYSAFYAAIHNWNAQDITSGQKAYLVFK